MPGATEAVLLGSTTGVRGDGNVLPVLVDSTGKMIARITPAPLGTSLSNSSGNVANASAVATLAGAAGLTTYISGFAVTGAGATAGLPVNVTVAGLLGGTQTYSFVFPAGVLVGALPLVVQFSPPLPASAVNTAIVVTCPAGGAGNTNAAASAWGVRQ